MRQSGLIQYMEIGHIRHGNRPNWKHYSFNFPERAVLFILLSTLTVSCLSCSTCLESLRYAVYQRPRLLMGFQMNVGMGSPTIQNLSLVILPLTIEMLIWVSLCLSSALRCRQSWKSLCHNTDENWKFGWLKVVEFSLLRAFGITCFFHATTIKFQRYLNTSGHSCKSYKKTIGSRGWCWSHPLYCGSHPLLCSQLHSI